MHRSQDEVEMFTTTWCGYCTRLKRFMDSEGIPYREVNIEHDPEAAEFVMAVNGGNRTVPTLRLPDGTALTTPRRRSCWTDCAVRPKTGVARGASRAGR